jgi:predicted acylesterase/phospholipase RssA
MEKEETKKEETKKEETENGLKDTIEHLVISGGCIWGLYEYGALKELHNCGFWNISNIKTMYGTSIGSIIATLLSLKIDFDTIDDYIIGRPWHDLWRENSYNLLETYNHLGVFHKNVISGTFSPLFKSCDIEINISMREFYEKTGIEIHIYITELNQFVPIDISYKTHPDWQIIDAIYASCTIPVMFAPIVEANNCYVDGGFFSNYPLENCLQENMERKNSILGIITKNDIKNEIGIPIITEDSTFFEFTSILMNRIINQLLKNKNSGIIKYEIEFSVPSTTIEYIYKIISSKEERSKLINDGMETSREYYQKWISEIPPTIHNAV